jgi:DNA-binding response OmpR family regulator
MWGRDALKPTQAVVSLHRKAGSEVARILVADDDNAIRRLLQRVLSREGYAVSTAANGQEALAQIERDPPDLLLLDLMMPMLSGWEVYAHLRRQGPADLPVIVLTAGEQATRAQQRLSGALVISKPFDLDALLSAIESLLAKRKKQGLPPQRAA